MEKKIKIAHVITRLDWGGSSDIVRLLCTHLNPAQYDIRLIIGLTEHATTKTRTFMDAFDQKITVIPELRRDINPWLDTVALVRLYRIFCRQKFDIVHTHTAKAGALGRLAALLAGVGVRIHTPHGHNFYGYAGPVISWVIISIEKCLAKITSRIIALTELEKNDFIRYGVAGQKRVSLVYQGLDLREGSGCVISQATTRKSLGITPCEKVVGMVARLEPVKGCEHFIAAAGMIARQAVEVKFLVVGQGSLRPALENQAALLGLKEKFVFTGWRDDVRALLSAMDIVVLPSLNEAVGIVLIEAQSCGVPVVATRVGGIPEVVKDGDTGLLVEPGDSKAIAGAVIQLLQDDVRRSAMSSAAQVWVEGKFKVQDMVDNTSFVYQSFLTHRVMRV
jgi:glycosyltransferase involved in cell wall biosynthesis